MTKSFLLILVISLSSFTPTGRDGALPKTIQRSTTMIGGTAIEKTIIEFDKSTSREDVIHTCAFLSKEGTQLTFDKLTIGKSFLGVVGRSRIKYAAGRILLADGSTQSFKVGGITNFKSLKIQYTRNTESKASRIEMIEKID